MLSMAGTEQRQKGRRRGAAASHILPQRLCHFRSDPARAFGASFWPRRTTQKYTVIMQSTATKPISTATVSIENYLPWEKWTDYPKVGRFCRRVKDRQPHFVPCLACLFIIPAPID